MSGKPDPEQYSDKEAERRATDAIRRALTTPYKPQSDMVGKVGRKSAKRPPKKPKKAVRR
jgi:hypothetical protein